MILTTQGFIHFTDGLNNQDFGIETPRMLLVLDGCSGCEYSEVGTRLFAQLFSRKEEFDSLEKFEDNVKAVFDDIISKMKDYYPLREELEREFIAKNLLFTIIACFQTDDSYIVKLFGDGYIITVNARGKISYIKFAYGDCPPYFAYKYCNMPDYENSKFKTYVFPKEKFPKVAISTDGIFPIVRNNDKSLDRIVTGNSAVAETILKSNRQCFGDDVTIGIWDSK